MKEILRHHCSGLQTAWHDGLAGEVKRSAIAFFTLAVLAFIICLALPDLRQRLVDYTLSMMGGLDIQDQSGTLSAPALLSNNIRACVFTMMYGLIPFLLLPALSLGVNAMLLGVLGAWYVSEGVSPLVYLAAVIPHGIFELPALILAFATGLYVCGQVTRLCRGNKEGLHVWDCLLLMSRVLLLVLLPLLAAAAVVEAYVTPFVASLFI
nr:stage II sporulation protein M [uncultured Oscillibacter sp.]